MISQNSSIQFKNFSQNSAAQANDAAQFDRVSNHGTDGFSSKDGQETPVIKGNKMLGDTNEVKLSDIITYDTLGAGAQGQVRKAVHKPTKKILAMKEIPMQSNQAI